ncbi:lysophospholipase [Kozakia baliensis NRIC 0488]|nr:alpha/beta fold hydrolase [Kozakia baliensis]GBR30082.1 lysophospholipase [Kozakia baliensis NRIC 0488]
MIRDFSRLSNRCRIILLSLALLTGCVAKPRHAPQPRGQEAALIPPSITLRLSDGAAIPIRIWPAQGETRAVVLALHGYGDSRDAWEIPAPILAEKGIAVYAPDQRGFGQAPRRGGWSSTKRMVQDAAEEIAWLHRRCPNTPLYIMGESMGGAVALLLDEMHSPIPVAGTILVAPAIWRFDPGSRLALSALDAVAPNWTFTAADVPGEHVATDNLAALRRLYFDPLTLRESKLHPLRGLVELMAEAREQAAHARTPLLVLYGDRDQFIEAGPMANFWRALPQDARRDLLHGGHHMLLRDRFGGRATQDIASWVLTPERLLPSGGDVTAAAWAAGDPGE